MKMATNKKHRGNVISLYYSLINRAALMSKLGYQYGGDRDLYEALGYITNLTYQNYLAQYERQDIAKAVIDRPVKATWKNGFLVVESDEYKDTQLEKAFEELDNRLVLKNKFARLDKLTGLGRYGVLLLGLDDIKSVSDWENPISTGRKYNLIYVKPLGEINAEITEYVSDTSSERYGQPMYYTVEIENLGNSASQNVKVHWSRAIHVVDDNLDSEIEGEPRLKVVFNRLQDLEKIVGASAEMFWRGARPGYQGNIDKDYHLTEEMKDDLQDQVDEFEHNLRRLLLLEGIDLKGLNPQVSDPSHHVDIQIQMISAATGIPKRILTGSELGELASTEDKNRWFELIESRRNDFAAPSIIRPFVDRCIEYRILPKPKEKYFIRWPDLWTMGDKEKAEIARIRSTALKEYSSMPIASSVISPRAFLRVIMALRPEEMGLVEEENKKLFGEEEAFNRILDTEGPEEFEEFPESSEE